MTGLSSEKQVLFIVKFTFTYEAKSYWETVIDGGVVNG